MVICIGKHLALELITTNNPQMDIGIQLPEYSSVGEDVLPQTFWRGQRRFYIIVLQLLPQVGDVSDEATMDAAPAPKAMLESKAAGVEIQSVKPEKKTVEVSPRKIWKNFVGFSILIYWLMKRGKLP